MLTEKKDQAGFSTFSHVAALLAFLITLGAGAELLAKGTKACSKTTQVAYKACLEEAQDDYWITVGNCYNLADSDARDECLAVAKEELQDAKEECKDKREARTEICDELGEDPYDPVIDPDDFVDFDGVLSEEEVFTPNPYFPLVPGTTWEYVAIDAGGEELERIFVEVLEETKEILGVNCIVVRDRVWEIDGEEEVLIEDTDDWYGQDDEGNVWYIGEIAQNFEDGELVDVEGSWKAGRDSAKAGYLMLADPAVGDYYRQEFFLGDAEDMGEVVARGQDSAEVPFGIYSNDVLRTRDWTPIEPDVFEFKYYAPGVGMVLEVNPDTGERVELVDMTTP